MNIDQMAHEFAMKLVGNPNTPLKDINSIVCASWSYVDAMQAESDKRKPKGLPDAIKGLESSKKIPPLDKDATIKYSDGLVIDWSQAPKWARWWAIDKDRLAFWHHTKPKNDDIEFYQCGEFCCYAPSFNYQGDWKNSLRKRP